MSKAVKIIHNVLLLLAMAHIVSTVSDIVSISSLADIMDSGVISSTISEKKNLLKCVWVLVIPILTINILHKIFKKEFIKPGISFYFFAVLITLIIILSNYTKNSAYRANHMMNNISSYSNLNNNLNSKKSILQVTHLYNDFNSTTPLEMTLEEANIRAKKFIASKQELLKTKYESEGYDLNYLPENSYDTIMIDSDASKIAQIKIVENGNTTDGKFQHTHFVLLGYKKNTLHTIICMNADTNNFINVPECYEKVNIIFN